MNPSFENKVAFIAGASGGINLAIAEAYGRAGARVVILSRNPERIEAAAEGLRALGLDATAYAGDVRDYDRLEAIFAEVAETHGPIDVLVSGAAGNFLAPAAKLSPNGFKTVVDIDLLGTFNVFHAAFAHLRKPGAALIAITAGQAVNPHALPGARLRRQGRRQHGGQMPGAGMGTGRHPCERHIAGTDQGNGGHVSSDSRSRVGSRP